MSAGREFNVCGAATENARRASSVRTLGTVYDQVYETPRVQSLKLRLKISLLYRLLISPTEPASKLALKKRNHAPNKGSAAIIIHKLSQVQKLPLIFKLKRFKRPQNVTVYDTIRYDTVR